MKDSDARHNVALVVTLTGPAVVCPTNPFGAALRLLRQIGTCNGDWCTAVDRWTDKPAMHGEIDISACWEAGSTLEATFQVDGTDLPVLTRFCILGDIPHPHHKNIPTGGIQLALTVGHETQVSYSQLDVFKALPEDAKLEILESIRGKEGHAGRMAEGKPCYCLGCQLFRMAAADVVGEYVEHS